MHATVFQQDEPKDKLRSLYFVFERINSGGIRLSPQEIRNCISESAVLDAVRLLNEDVTWRTLFGEKKNSRFKDQELILRALAMIGNRDKYSAPMRDFLNDFASDEEKTVSPTALEELKRLFRASIDIIFKAKGRSAFRPDRALNAAVLEAVVVGLSERIRSKSIDPDITKVALSYDALLKNENFTKAISTATAREENVETRQREAIEAFVRT